MEEGSYLRSCSQEQGKTMHQRSSARRKTGLRGAVFAPSGETGCISRLPWTRDNSCFLWLSFRVFPSLSCSALSGVGDGQTSYLAHKSLH